MNYTLIGGIVSNLDRATQVSGGGDSVTTTTHIAIFGLSGERVLLRTPNPAMIADGDNVRLVGQHAQGQFTAIACRNISTGWTTSSKRQGCATAALIGFTLVGLAFTFIFPLFIFMPLVSGFMLGRVIITDSRIKDAHMILNR